MLPQRNLDHPVAGGAGAPKVNLRGRSGRQSTVSTRLPEPESPAELATFLVISRSRPGGVAPQLLAAYGLTAREQKIAHCVRLGLSTAEMAARLHLSAYTVQDHLKRIFAKVGVSSRGEFMAVVFRQASPLPGARSARGDDGTAEG